ncbi:MAG: FAD-dependent oxidoreductase [Undibacterium sp.]|nr:FAD-dependent oxidoreductase [Undibacterium sp.]
MQAKQRIAVIGSGVSGLVCAHFLQKKHQITLFEANDYLGGHTNTVDISIGGEMHAVDTGFLVFNEKTYPNLIALFKELQVESYATDMSFGVSLDHGKIEWAGSNLDTVFAQRKNLVSPTFLLMLKDIVRFNRDAQRHLDDALVSKISLGQLLTQEKYRSTFKNHYLIPMAAAIWSSAPSDILDFPASTFLRFCMNHGLLQINDRPKWRTVKNGARSYVQKIAAQLSDIRLNTPVLEVTRHNEGQEVWVRTASGISQFDQVVFATHAPDTMRLLSDASLKEKAILSQFRYQSNAAYLHTDTDLLPTNPKVWSAWNYLSKNDEGSDGGQSVCVSYLLNKLQTLSTKTPVIVTLNPIKIPAKKHQIAQYQYEHPIFDQKAIDAQLQLAEIQGENKAWFAGAWSGYGFHEDGVKSALSVLKAFELSPHWARP